MKIPIPNIFIPDKRLNIKTKTLKYKRIPCKYVLITKCSPKLYGFRKTRNESKV